MALRKSSGVVMSPNIAAWVQVSWVKQPVSGELAYLEARVLGAVPLCSPQNALMKAKRAVVVLLCA